MQSAVLPSYDLSIRIANLNQQDKQDMLHPQQHAVLPGMQTTVAGLRPLMDKATPQAVPQGNRQAPSLESRPRSNAGCAPLVSSQMEHTDISQLITPGAIDALFSPLEMDSGYLPCINTGIDPLDSILTELTYSECMPEPFESQETPTVPDVQPLQASPTMPGTPKACCEQLPSCKSRLGGIVATNTPAKAAIVAEDSKERIETQAYYLSLIQQMEVHHEHQKQEMARNYTDSLAKLEEKKRHEYNQLLLQMRADITQQHNRDLQQQQQQFHKCMWEMQNADQAGSKNLAAQLEAAQLHLKSMKAQHQAAISNLEQQVKQLSGQVLQLQALNQNLQRERNAQPAAATFSPQQPYNGVYTDQLNLQHMQGDSHFIASQQHAPHPLHTATRHPQAISGYVPANLTQPRQPLPAAELQGIPVPQSPATNFSLYQQNTTVGCYEAVTVQQYHDSDTNDSMQFGSDHGKKAVTLPVKRRRPREFTEEQDGNEGAWAAEALNYTADPAYVHERASYQQKRAKLG